MSVFTGPPGEDLPDRAIIFERVTQESAWAQLGAQRREETPELEGVVYALEPGGADESGIKAARDKAKAMLDELDAELRVNMTQGVTEVHQSALAVSEWRQPITQAGRVCEIGIRIRLKARI